ncbi:chitobiase/beta-hexosaminidase C-terminal domain-containing protein [Desulfonema magnum]|uniref:GH29D-like beta-sandwich domain-containing protein n=1 Tax=Desulfonema magnum TaxID=45655 RepID=A0A975BZG0_9BACT|nr:chitobiase/beta-hexosaminidase C-terminal domain-containing protein [Desulfonema magnum]QTA93847.1 Uncharacterized protein dnm_099550 [Desulfonema magnum]
MKQNTIHFGITFAICLIGLFFIPAIASTDRPDIYEKDDTYDLAHIIVPNDDIQKHNFHKSGDEDWVKFRGAEGVSYTIGVYPVGKNTGVIVELYEYNSEIHDLILLEYQEMFEEMSEEISLTMIRAESSLCYVRIRHYDPDAYGEDTAYEIKLETFPSPSVGDEDGFFPTEDIYEDDNRVDQASVIIPNTETQHHSFHNLRDEDWVKFDGTEGKNYNLEINIPEAGCDILIQIYNAEMKLLEEFESSWKLWEWDMMNCYSWFSCKQDGVYYLKVRPLYYTLQVCGENRTYDLKLNTFCSDLYEEDDIFFQAGWLTPCGTYEQHNFHDAEDEDWFGFDAISGQIYTVEVKTKGKMCDPVIEFYDTDGVTLLDIQDNAGSSEDESLSWLAPQDGFYYVKIHHRDPNVYGEDTEYEIVVNNVFCPDFYEKDDVFFLANHIDMYEPPQQHNFHTAGDEDWVEFFVMPSKYYSIRTSNMGKNCDVAIEIYRYDYDIEELIWLASQDSPGASEDTSLTWLSGEEKSYYVKIRHRDPNVYGENTEYEVSLTTPCSEDGFCPDIHEDDDTFSDAVLISPYDGIFQRHNFHDSGDEDWIKFDGKSGVMYEIEVYSIGADTDFIMELYDSDGVTLLDSYSGERNKGGHLKWLSDKDSVYYMKVRHRDPDVYGRNTAYEIWIYAYSDIYEEDDSFDLAATIMPAYSLPNSGIGEGKVAQIYNNFPVPGDEDWFKFDALSGEPYTIEAVELGENADIVIEIYDSDGETLLVSQDNAGVATDESLTWIPPENTTYYVKTRNQDTEVYGTKTRYNLNVGGGGGASAFAGSVEGVVMDNFTKAYIEGATIKTSSNIYTLSLPNGGYRMTHPAGTYTITAEASGYETFTDALTVEETGTTSKDILMIPITGTVATPELSPAPGTYTTEQLIKIKCETPGATIRYTKDGTEPSDLSPAYVTPLAISETTTLRAKAYKNNWTESDMTSGVYEITGTVEKPIFFPDPGTYTVELSAELSCATPDAVIYYTTDGSEPTELSLVYIEPVSVSETTTIKAKAFKISWEASDTAEETYIITGTVAMPTFSPEPATYTTGQDVALLCATPDAIIYYTTDGTDPSESSMAYSGPVSVVSTTIIKAGAFKTDWAASSVATGIYTITGTVAMPVFSPPPGTYPSARNIEISCATAGATIHYTTDGSDPTEISPVYSSPVPVPSGMTIKARAFKTDWAASAAVTGKYTITGTVATPVFSPAPGTYASAQQVGISCDTPGASIHYTTDGSNPTESSPVYNSPVPVSSAVTIKAKAFKTDWAESAAVTGNYTITGTVATPAFSPAPGTYASPQQVGISCDTPGASIHYTTDGREPTENSPVYNSPVPVSSAVTIKAKAFKTDWAASAEATGKYTITGTVVMPVFSPPPGTYPSARNVEISCDTAGATIHYTTDGREPSESSPVYNSPVPVSSAVTIKAKAFKTDWVASAAVTGKYTITGTVATPAFSPAPGTYASPQQVGISCDTPGATIHYTTDGGDPTEISPIYNSPVPVPSGMTIKAKAFKTDWAASAAVTGKYTITGTVATPAFSPAPGTYASPRQVGISCDTPGATIHYTTDGTGPTENSPVYSSPISVSVSTVIKAIAFKSEWTPSNTISAIYTITGTAESPTFSPTPGTYTASQHIELSGVCSGASVHYTTDGNEPTESSRLYTSPILVSSTTTIKAKAFKTDWNPSTTATGVYIITQTVESPVFLSVPGTYITEQHVALSCPTSGADIHYTTNGTDPTEESPAYLSPISVSETMTIKARAFKTDWIPSHVTTGIYTITGTVEPPVFSPDSDMYLTSQEVELSCPAPGVVIRYTTDGSDPTEDSPAYSSPISVSETTTIKAKAFKTDWAPSNTVRGNYIITTIESPESGGGACFLNTLFKEANK